MWACERSLLGGDELILILLVVVLLQWDRGVDEIAGVDVIRGEVAGASLGNCGLGEELIPSRLDLAVDTDLHECAIGVGGGRLRQELVLVLVKGSSCFIELLLGGSVSIVILGVLPLEHWRRRRVARRLRLMQPGERATVGVVPDLSGRKARKVLPAAPDTPSHRTEAVSADNGLVRRCLLHEGHLRASGCRLPGTGGGCLAPVPHLPVPIRLLLAGAPVGPRLLVDQLEAVTGADDRTSLIALQDVVKIPSVRRPIAPPEERMLEGNLDALVIPLPVPSRTVDHRDRVLARDQLADPELAKDREHHLGGDVTVDVADVENECLVRVQRALDTRVA